MPRGRPGTDLLDVGARRPLGIYSAERSIVDVVRLRHREGSDMAQRHRRPGWQVVRRGPHGHITQGSSQTPAAWQLSRPAAARPYRSTVIARKNASRTRGRPYPGQPVPMPARPAGAEKRSNASSQRVRRQGLEPRTRGLRVRCSAN
jgi:hypothetical protein